VSKREPFEIPTGVGIFLELRRIADARRQLDQAALTNRGRAATVDRSPLTTLFGSAPPTPSIVMLSTVGPRFQRSIPAIDRRLYEAATQADSSRAIRRRLAAGGMWRVPR
jgi:hypothetical protein